MAVKSRRTMSLVRHKRIRRALRGTTDRPRLAVFRSTNHIYAQIIDDEKGVTLASASSLGKRAADMVTGKNHVEAANEVGKAIATAAKEANIKQVVFDRGGFAYHGRVKALAEGAREAGLEF